MTNDVLRNSRPRIGVVMGSGGTKALAGVALFEFLDSIGLSLIYWSAAAAAGLCALCGGVNFQQTTCAKCSTKCWIKVYLILIIVHYWESENFHLDVLIFPMELYCRTYTY